jgi:type IV secretion system protein VirD4
LMMLDEFANLGALKIIENGYGLIAGHGVTLWSFVQNLTQLQNLYPKNWEAFIANSAAVTVSNVNDVTTAKYFSERAAKDLVTRTSYSQGSSSGNSNPSGLLNPGHSSQSSGSSSSSNTSQVWEDSLPVRNLYGERPTWGFIFLEGYAEPVKIYKNSYDLFPPFNKRADPHPMHKG